MDVEAEAIWRMMPDYGGECLWRVGGPAIDVELSPMLQQRLDLWVGEWEQFHLCPVRDDEHEAWVREGRALYDLAADEFRAVGVRLLADFEGSDEQQAERRRAWHERWGSPLDGD